MKKIINFLSILGIVAAPCWITYLYLKETPALEATVAPQKEAFPLNQTRFVEFRADEGSLDQLTERERMDQLRDWLLFTVVSNQGLSVDELNQSLYDLSTVRYGYMKPVSNFEYGETRSLYLGKGRVVALLPKGRSQEERMDDLAHIADKHRKDTGQIPTTIEVFDYEIKPDKEYAFLTRRDVLNARMFFSEGKHGYHEAAIKSLDDLERFMNQVDDVTLAQVKDSTLFLGGRKILSRDYQGIRVEDVAAIWQSEKKIQSQLAEFDGRWQEKARDLPPEQREQARQQALNEWRQLKLVNGSGFSLDPSYDYRGLKSFLVKGEPVLQQLVSEDAAAITQQDIENAKSGLDKEDILPYLQLADRLTKSDNPKVARFGDFLSHQQRVVYSFQAARYDGDLQGTEVGMILFYTDLLAKLWGFNYQDATPEKDIQDFRPKTKIDVSSIYKQELKELPSTRTWFGPNDKGFQVADEGNSIIFARNATRIYAASSNPLQPGIEKATSAVSDIFLGWWNSHYEEVARYEPQYERLNEIMKWSLLISWLNKANKGETLEFLQGVQVKRDNWFPNWVQANGDRLTYEKWTQVGFHQRGYKGTKTEAMPILLTETFKRFGELYHISGGVSLANKELFEGRAALPATSEVGELGRRSNLKYDAVSAIDDSLNLNTLEGTAYKLKNVEQGLSSVTAKAKEGVKFRSPDAELKNQEFSRTVSQTPSGIQIDTSIGGTDLGSFSVNKTQNSFTVGFLSRDIDVGHSLGLRLSRYKGSWEQALKEMPDVQVALMSRRQPPEYIVKMSDSKQWLKITPEPKSGAGGKGGGFDPPFPPSEPGVGGGRRGGGFDPPVPPKDWDFSVGDFGDDSRNLRFSWLDEQQVKQQQVAGDFEQIKQMAADAPDDPTVQAFGENLRNGRYRQLAQEITDNPVQFRVRKKKHLEAGLKKSNDLLKQGKNTEAAQLLDSLIQVHGPEPNLKMYQALVNLRQGKLNAKEVFPNTLGGTTNFLDQVNGLLELSQGKVNFSRIETDTAFFYVLDHPGLNNLDWNVPMEQSVPSGSGARVYQLRPGKIGETPLYLSGLGDASASAHPSTQFRGSNINNALRNVVNTDNNECKENTEKENRKNANCLQEKPTYVVIMPENT
jgi:hypothetical protein